MFRMLSFWNPNFWARSKKMSSISSVEMGACRSAVHAGKGSLDPGMSANGLPPNPAVLVLICELIDSA